MKMKLGLLILSGGENVQACGNIVIFPHCGRCVLRNALVFFCRLTHFLSYLTLWAPEQSAQRSLKCEAKHVQP